METNYISFEEARELVRWGWLIQYRGTSLISSWIKLVSGGVHSHSAMIVPGPLDSKASVAEMREFRGGTVKTLEEHYKESAGIMDFYEPQVETFPELNLGLAATGMLKIAENGKYAYGNLLKILVRKLPFMWRMYDRGFEDDLTIDVKAKRWHCSDSVAAAYQYGGVDPVPHLPNYLVAPTDLTRSLLFKYRFSL